MLFSLVTLCAVVLAFLFGCFLGAKVGVKVGVETGWKASESAYEKRQQAYNTDKASDEDARTMAQRLKAICIKERDCNHLYSENHSYCINCGKAWNT